MYTVGIPAYNEEHVISGTLNSVRAQIHPDAEILVCANACTDRTAAIARNHGARVIEDERGGLVRAVNTLFREAKYSKFIKVDADVQLGPDAISWVMRGLECNIVVGAQRVVDTRGMDVVTRLYLSRRRESLQPEWQAQFCGRMFGIDLTRFREVLGHFGLTELPDGMGDNALIRALLDMYADKKGEGRLWTIEKNAHVVYRPASFLEAPSILARTGGEGRRLRRKFPEWKPQKYRMLPEMAHGRKQVLTCLLRRYVRWRARKLTINPAEWVRSEASRKTGM